MRNLVLSVVCVLVMGTTVYFSASAQKNKTGEVNLQMFADGRPVAGLIRVIPKNSNTPIPLEGLYHRLKGLESSAPVKYWYVIPAKATAFTLPPGEYTLEALSGLQTELERRSIRIAKGQKITHRLELSEILPLTKRQLIAGNTHLHLRNMTLPQADEYLRTIPPADRLQVLFISYLERHKDDKSYITNRYPIGELKQFNATGVLINNGEEHRHNFTGFGQGYGHVMLLDIKKLIKPVSIGPGIMAAGFDDTPLRPGIDNAKKQGGTIIWCHNTFGYEDVLNALTNRLDALNVFDGSRRDQFEDTYYRYLNIGLRMPISTGTDWFMYDFSRLYAKVPGKLSIKSWLQAVKKGRCQATNGPLLQLQVDGKELGDTIKIDKPRAVKIAARGVGRQAFGDLQLIHNGNVIKSKPAKHQRGHYTSAFEHDVLIDRPGWLALRINCSTKNELGKQVYAHTSPIYVEFQGGTIFDVKAAQVLLRQIEEGKAAIRAQGTFSTPQAQQRVLALYDDASAMLTKRINQQK